MSGKVDFGHRTTTKVNTGATPATPAATPAPAPAVSPEATVAAAPPPSAPAATFDAAAPAPKLFDGPQTGAPVASSAAPSNLWGVEGHHHHPDGGVDGTGKLTPEQIAALKDKRDQSAQQIGDRVDHLEHKWRYTRDTTKTNELWRYAHDSSKMDDPTRAKLESKLCKTDHDQARLDRLQQQAKNLGQSGTPEQRTELAHQIEAVKKDITTDLADANQVVKDAGLEVDHLAHAESTIDPHAPKGQPSLFDLVSSFFSSSMSIMYGNYFGDAMDVTMGSTQDLQSSLSNDKTAAADIAMDRLRTKAVANDVSVERELQDQLAESLKGQRLGFRS